MRETKRQGEREREREREGGEYGKEKKTVISHILPLAML